MQLENYVFGIVDKILNCIAGIIGLLLLLYACYTWWDTQQIYENASATSYLVYNPEVKEEDEKTALLEYIDQYAIQKRKCKVTASEHLLVLSTCTSGETNGRDILIGKIVDVDN